MLARHAGCLLLRQQQGSSSSSSSSCLAAALRQQARSFMGGPPGGDGGALGDTASAGAWCEAADAILAASSAAETASVAAASATCWWGSKTLVAALVHATDVWGMPWWAAITASSAALRIVGMAMSMMTQYHAPVMEAMKAEAEQLKELIRRQNKATSPSEFVRAKSQYDLAVKNMTQKYKGVHLKVLGGTVLGLVNIPLVISQFGAVTALAGEKLPSMTRGGLAWFSDLTVPDPYMALPAICALTTLAMVESGGLTPGAAQAMTPTMKRMGRMGALMVLPVGYFTSSAIGAVWASNSAFHLASALLLSNPTTRQWLRLPAPRAAPSPPDSSAAFGSDWAQWLQPKQQQQQQQQQPAPPTAAGGKAGEGAGLPPPPGTRVTGRKPQVKLRSR